jgi:hypothetical protein
MGLQYLRPLPFLQEFYLAGRHSLAWQPLSGIHEDQTRITKFLPTLKFLF